MNRPPRSCPDDFRIMRLLIKAIGRPRLLGLALGVGGWAASLSGEEPAEILTEAIQIRSLSHEEALRALPVRIRGTVIFIASKQDVFVQDDTAGTFFQAQDANIRPGDIVEVSGETKGGLYLPGIEMTKFQVLGNGPLPEALPVTYDDLRSGRFHYQRVAVQGVVRACSRDAAGRVTLQIGAGQPRIEVRIEPGESPDLSALVGSEIRAEGLAAGSINPRRQLVQPYVQLRDWGEVAVLNPAIAAADVPRVSAGQLLTFRVTGAADSRVRIEGVVTAFLSDGLVCLRQGETPFAVRLADGSTVGVGDRVEVAGFPEMGFFSATLMDAALLHREPGPAPQPVKLTLADLMSDEPVRDHDHDLVEVEALVTDAYRAPDGLVLAVQDGGKRAEVRAGPMAKEVAVGSLVRIRAICMVESSGGARYSTRVQGVTLHIRAPGDLFVLKAPSPWTARRLAGVLAVLGAFVLLAGLWITILRRQVSQQTTALRESIESEAALEERQRIAREFHDTLEQELAGLRLRLDAAATREIDEKGRGLLAASRNLVGRIQVETRNLILDLRSSAEAAGDLGLALRELVEVHGGQPGVVVLLEPLDVLPTLPAATVHHVRMIAAEGVTNALKHSRATEIRVGVEAKTDVLVVRVTDNGVGFEVDANTVGKSGHFGCVGIRERCRKIGATVRWESQRGRGTVMELSVPWTADSRAYPPGNREPVAEPVV